MPTKANGQIYENRGKRGMTYGLRFRLPDGRRVYEKLGPMKGEPLIDRREAERRAEVLLARVRLGQYRTKEERAAEEEARKAESESPLFARFAEEWLARRRVIGGRRGTGLSASAENDLGWRLNVHLIPWFGGLRLDQISEEEVERYATAKRAAAIGSGGLGATSVNKTLSTLEAILDVAVRWRRIGRNPVAGYRVPGSKYVAAHLDTAAQMVALLDAAGELDRGRRVRQGHGRALLATLLLAGLRLDEALSLRWKDVNLATGTLRVREGKTENAARTVYLADRPRLREELTELRARRGGDRDALIFGTSSGGKESQSNIRRRVLAPSIALANKRLAKAGEETIPESLTPHGLRHTNVSVLFLLGEDAGYVADQVGHSDAGFTYKKYRKRIERRDGEPERLRALFYGAPIGEPIAV